MKHLTTFGAVLALAFAGAAHAGAYEEMQKCDDQRPKICGQKGAPSCKEVQDKIDACKARVREAEVKRINSQKK